MTPIFGRIAYLTAGQPLTLAVAVPPTWPKGSRYEVAIIEADGSVIHPSLRLKAAVTGHMALATIPERDVRLWLPRGVKLTLRLTSGTNAVEEPITFLAAP